MQTAIVIIIVAACCYYIGRRYYRSFKAEQPTCGCAEGCDTCATQTDNCEPVDLIETKAPKN